MKLLKRILLGILANGATLYLVTYALDEVNYTGGWKFFMIAGIFIGLLNVIVKPILKLLSLPFVLLSAGLFLIVINAVILWLTKHLLEVAAIGDIRLIISGIGNYLVAAFVFGLANWIVHIFIKKPH